MRRNPALIPIITAWLNGETVEVYDRLIENWIRCEDPLFNSSPSHYRIAKPLRPYTLEELYSLVGETITQENNGGRYLVTAAYTHINWGKGEPAVALGGHPGPVTASELLTSFTTLAGTRLGERKE